MTGLEKALALANKAAFSHGTDPAASLITLSEETTSQGRCWRVNYVPRDYRNQRGGDLIVFVDEAAEKVQRVIYGQ